MNKIFSSLFFDHSVTDLDFWSDQLLGSQGGGGGRGGDGLMGELNVSFQGDLDELCSNIIGLPDCSTSALVAVSSKGAGKNRHL